MGHVFSLWHQLEDSASEQGHCTAASPAGQPRIISAMDGAGVGTKPGNNKDKPLHMLNDNYVEDYGLDEANNDVSREAPL